MSDIAEKLISRVLDEGKAHAEADYSVMTPSSIDNIRTGLAKAQVMLSKKGVRMTSISAKPSRGETQVKFTLMFGTPLDVAAFIGGGGKFSPMQNLKRLAYGLTADDTFSGHRSPSVQWRVIGSDGSVISRSRGAYASVYDLEDETW